MRQSSSLKHHPNDKAHYRDPSPKLIRIKLSGLDSAMSFGAERQAWRSVVGPFPRRKEGAALIRRPLSVSCIPAPSTKSRRWVEISDGLLFVTNQKVRTRMSLEL
jgi:hypothetical protein